MRLKDKVSVITGGASGMGRATALKFVKEGAKVVIADMDEAGGKETVELIQAAGGEAVFVQTDVSCYEQVERAVKIAVEKFGTLDVMFNNAGIVILKPILEMTPEEYDKVVQVNQYGVFNGILAASRKMVELKSKGVIINTASTNSYVAVKYNFNYCASKAAVQLMTQAGAVELGDEGIRVVAIAPSGTDTPFVEDIKAVMEQRATVNHARGKLLKSEQIANAVAFLASDESDAVNGSTLMLDDGMVGFRR